MTKSNLKSVMLASKVHQLTKCNERQSQNFL